METIRVSPVEVQVGAIIYRFDNTSTADGFDKAIRDDLGVGHATLDHPWRDSRSARSEDRGDSRSA